MHIMSTNFAKTLVWKQEYDVKFWHHEQCAPNTNDHHMPLNETPPMKIFCVRHWVTHTSLEYFFGDIIFQILLITSENQQFQVIQDTFFHKTPNHGSGIHWKCLFKNRFVIIKLHGVTQFLKLNTSLKQV